ncbi:nitroreductase [Rhodobacter aestuarii]|uniref:Nitroreductase n=1 Tax=Rhodobacter aestuarii TaxID=453582 RepID=A0A1N7PBZ1_9RHOB|nr:NAD(P)H-dependent oxidoreductase [Rhodobacter aestuarii]PTV97729.1 nitroreductase [Rhodobacter aestuarii]SIT08122.1 Nitroreductase [Rhodobacter aestuarii]
MLIDTLNWRYATKKMDPAKAVPEEKVARILAAAQLAPTSSGLQPFEILVITNADLRAQLRGAAYDQAQVTDGSHLIVFAAWDNYTDARIEAVVDHTVAERGIPREMVTPYYDNLKAQFLPRPAEVNFDHAARQAYIAFGIALAQAAEEEVDATPMEGFDPAKVDEILGLREKGLRSVTLMPLGYRANEGDWLLGMKKVRKPLSELVTRID